MKYLIAEANYGGRITDDWDRRLVNVYISEFISEDMVSSEKFMLSDLPDYFVGEEGDLTHYKTGTDYAHYSPIYLTLTLTFHSYTHKLIHSYTPYTGIKNFPQSDHPLGMKSYTLAPIHPLNTPIHPLTILYTTLHTSISVRTALEQ